MRVLIINGANVNLPGRYPTEVEGVSSYSQLTETLHQFARKQGVELEIFQSNSEGEVVNLIQGASDKELDALIINPGDFLHSHPIRGALMALAGHMPLVEVLPAGIHSLGGPTLLTSHVQGVIAGFGVQAYLLALEAVLDLVKGTSR
ncbi:MAG: type II 3-dehydroquinate dehydratase [Thermodesulfobacteriota bacterium]